MGGIAGVVVAAAAAAVAVVVDGGIGLTELGC